MSLLSSRRFNRPGRYPPNVWAPWAMASVLASSPAWCVAGRGEPWWSPGMVEFSASANMAQPAARETHRTMGKSGKIWETHRKSWKIRENHGKIMGKLWKIHHFSWNQLFTYGPFAIAKCNKVPEGTPISCHCPICSCIFPLTCAFVQTLSLFNLHDFAI